MAPTVAGGYRTFVLVGGALRVLVVLHFYALGYSPLRIALLLLACEVFGAITCLLGGRPGPRTGPQRAGDARGGLRPLVAAFARSGSVRRGAGFFLGGALLGALGFRDALIALALGLALAWLAGRAARGGDPGRADAKPRFRRLFAGGRAVNLLAAARICLFGARDVWFVVALPLHLVTAYDWSPIRVGAFLALWTIGYAAVAAAAPRFAGPRGSPLPDGQGAERLAGILALVPAMIAVSPGAESFPGKALLPGGLPLAETALLGGLLLFGTLFAVNTALHNALIAGYASRDRASVVVGITFLAGLMGRLGGTALSGWLYQARGLAACLVASSALLLAVALLSLALPRSPRPAPPGPKPPCT